MLCTVPIMLTTFLACFEAFISDVKSLFLEVDLLSRHKTPDRPKQENLIVSEHKNVDRRRAAHRLHYQELKMLERFKEALDLHAKVLR